MLSTKLIIEKLSGNKKFEVDEKLGFVDFVKLLENVSENNFDSQKTLVEKMELSIQGNQIFKDDLENPLYKRMAQLIKEMKKPPGKGK